LFGKVLGGVRLVVGVCMAWSSRALDPESNKVRATGCPHAAGCGYYLNIIQKNVQVFRRTAKRRLN
jgi:hypothetical protein